MTSKQVSEFIAQGWVMDGLDAALQALIGDMSLDRCLAQDEVSQPPLAGPSPDNNDRG